MLVIIDYKMGNLGSIANMLKKIGHPSIITSDTEVIKKATKIILPGVGSFDAAMKNIKELGLLELLNNKALSEKIPFLGICLGMQLLTQKSEEGFLPGLGWVNAETIKFKVEDQNLKIPHMGWNTISLPFHDVLFEEMPKNSRFYFVHSYHVLCNSEENVFSKSIHGYEFASGIKKDNIMGVQFHPEKSHKFGMQLLKNFVERC